MDSIHHISPLRERLAPLRGTSVIGLVPTMGALHAGHVRLIDTARQECECVVVSIFVNPLQFDRQEDLSRYPRTLDADMSVCRERGVDVVFAPATEEMYPAPPVCSIDVGRLGEELEGKYRPGHFRGVATVVLKLFQIVQPNRAYFGEKDAQQVAIVKRMASDFNLPLSIVEVATVREADGLALSSRNRRLSSLERQSATALYRALCEAQRRVANGEGDVRAIIAAALAEIPQTELLRLEYLEIVDPEEMRPVTSVRGPVRAVGALWVGTTRLIDNVLCVP